MNKLGLAKKIQNHFTMLCSKIPETAELVPDGVLSVFIQTPGQHKSHFQEPLCPGSPFQEPTFFK
jgi:hypothetical protein